jgi:GNAT superfamily N-acetyltransferase
MSVRIRRARPSEGERLREIAIASKRHWGYELARVEEWAATSDYSAPGIRAKGVFVAESGGQVVAWAALVSKGEVIWLDDLWVAPEWIGRGVGSLLFRHAVENARRLGGSRLEWEAEPNAVGFYEKLGCQYLRESEPGAWGRSVPVMGIALTRAPRAAPS